jgi:hypothetical protein
MKKEGRGREDYIGQFSNLAECRHHRSGTLADCRLTTTTSIWCDVKNICIVRS